MNKKYLSFRTDMADERVDTYKRVHNLSEVDGIKVTSDNKNGVITTVVEVLNENGEKAVLKKIGKYVTMEISDMNYLDENEKEDVKKQVSSVIKELIGENKKKTIMVVGLGNIAVTPDALGPKVVKNIDITRHLIKFAKELVDQDTREVSAISPGVLGTTGIETSEIIHSVTEKTKPEMLIVIDSLASGSIHRIGNTIQFSNTGITPGEGVRNKREELNEETLGIPVIAVGVPTVVDMATITNEAIDKMIDNAKNELDNEGNKEMLKVFEALEQDTRYDMIANVLNTQNYIVTPKEIDDVIDSVADIISGGINLAM
ncbi:MAG: GPR endopeptidase [Clostridia bacterium]|nr:GPR endopeptidase [Clostridia bacterium]